MQTIPINLSWTTVPVGVQAADINQLGTIIAAYMAGQISDDVTFVQVGAATPTQFQTLLFFNTSQGVWKYWNTGSGKYLTVTQFIPGDTKQSFVSGDEIQQGWVVLDGRAISAVAGLSQDQQASLEVLFGVGGTLPTVTVVQSLTGLPADGSFSDIAVADIQPPANQIGNLPFSGTYDATQSQALAANTETLRGSTSSLRTSVTSIQSKSELLLNALNAADSGTFPLTVKVFCGYPQ